LKNLLLAIAGIVSVSSYVPYIIAILRKQTKPMKASWLIWAILDSILFASMLYAKSMNWQMVGVVAGVWIVFFLALKFGTPGWKKLDKFCLIGAGCSIALWAITGDPVVGIVTSITANAIGSVPTILSTWEDPSHESRLAWTLAFVSSTLTLLGNSNWTLAAAAQPIMFEVVQVAMMFLLYVHPNRIRD
jgi:hypothetical protein